MSYFNHAFKKTFVGTTSFVQTEGTASSALSTGQFTFVNPNTWTIPPDLNDGSTLASPLVLVSGSIHTNDKIGPFHGGYTESVKSKMINPKYISKFYRVDPSDFNGSAAQQAQILVGATSASFTGSCAKTFDCGQTYNLRLDIKGSPVLRTLTRNTYYTSAAYTGCCADPTIVTNVNPLMVYAKWAFDFLNSPLIAPFINVQVTYSLNDGVDWSQLAPSFAYTDNGVPVPAGASSNMNETLGTTLSDYLMGNVALPGDETTLAGLIITGGYIDTRFQDCTFYPNDSIIAFMEPVKIYASEVDLGGDPCTFSGLCNNTQCLPIQGSGFGENIIRDLIMTEGYMQQPFYTGTDLRIREITNGDDVYNVIDRTSQYTRYYIQHNVPRFNNPTSTFDNDQYLLEIITDGTDVNFQDFVLQWLDNVGNPITLEEYTPGGTFECTPVPAEVAP